MVKTMVVPRAMRILSPRRDETSFGEPLTDEWPNPPVWRSLRSARASTFHCYGYGCCDVEFDRTGVHRRFHDGDGWSEATLPTTNADNVFCGPSCVFTNVINPRAEVSRKDEYRPTVVKRGASIGANATIVCGVTIGEYAFIGAGAVVTGDVPAYALMVGVPARPAGWMCRCGVRVDAPTDTCAHAG